MNLTKEEKEILEGNCSATLQKAMKSIVMYGDIFGARRLVNLTGASHFVVSMGGGVLAPYFELVSALIDAGLKMEKPFTVDPRPMDFKNISYSIIEKIAARLIYKYQGPYEKQLARLGLKSTDSFSCACCLDEVGNIPERGDILSWSESSAVAYANSVIGARTNRNSAGIDILCGVLGKTPEFGLLTDEGRKASWVMDVKTETLPPAQVLGSAIGIKAGEGVPYITGLDRLLGTELNRKVKDYLKDMGAAAASNGAVGLYHVENLTPEAAEQSRSIIREDHKRYTIDKTELSKIESSYPVIWKNPDSAPRKCFIGCPHLSMDQLTEWIEKIDNGLEKRKIKKLKTETILCAPPRVIEKALKDADLNKKAESAGVKLSGICPLMYMTNPLSSMRPVVTNSNKLRTYSTARFFPDGDIIEIICTGRLPGKKNHFEAVK